MQSMNAMDAPAQSLCWWAKGIGKMAKKMFKNTICLWYDHDAEAAARFYAATFPDSSVGSVHRAPSDYPGGKAGSVLTVDFVGAGPPLSLLHCGSPFHSRAGVAVLY